MDEIHIIRINFGESGSYGSKFQARYLRKYMYTGPRIGKIANFTPIKGPVLNNDKNYHNKIY